VLRGEATNLVNKYGLEKIPKERSEANWRSNFPDEHLPKQLITNRLCSVWSSLKNLEGAIPLGASVTVLLRSGQAHGSLSQSQGWEC
jgi:hypothetical protein